MLLWVVSAGVFLVSLVAWSLKVRITLLEALGLFVIVCTAFATQLIYLYHKYTTDEMLQSGYVSSMVYRPSYQYEDDGRTYTERERWLLEHTASPPRRNVKIQRPYFGHKDNLTEFCYGECIIDYPSGEPTEEIWEIGESRNGNIVYLLDVSHNKWVRTKLGSPSVLSTKYFNPVMNSDEAIYHDSSNHIQEFTIFDVNQVQRFYGPTENPSAVAAVEALNARMAAATNISIGLILASDPIAYEKLKRAWRGGNSNDFIVIVYSSDNRVIDNVNVLAWDNYALIEKTRQYVAAVKDLHNIPAILAAIERALGEGPHFIPRDFSPLSFLQIKIPSHEYLLIFGYQLILLAYLLTLFYFNPVVKGERTDWSEIAKTWDKYGYRSSKDPRYGLHPFASPGFILYLVIPYGGFFVLEYLLSP